MTVYGRLIQAQYLAKINGHVWREPRILEEWHITGVICAYCGAVSDEVSGKLPCTIKEENCENN